MAALRRILFLLTLGVGGAWTLRTFLYEPAIVESPSMEPTLYPGVHYLVNRWTYRLHAPQRGDLISFISPLDGKTRYIKRVIAVPGDRIELRDKRVILNDQPLEEPYAVYKRAKERLQGDTLGPLNVPEEMYFVLGDNRDESYDSTSWIHPTTGRRMHFLPRQNIKGRVVKL